MRRAFLLAAAAAAVGAAPAAGQSATFASLSGAAGLPVQRFSIDALHSAVEFTVRFMGMSTVRGAFADFQGTIMVDTADATRSSVSLVIDATTVNTNFASRDRHLRSPDFFDVEKHPRITFRSTRVESRGDGFVAHGPLSMRGVTREVSIPFRQAHGLAKDAWGNMRRTFVGRVRLNRRDFGIVGTAFFNTEFDPGRMGIADSVDVDLTISALLSNTELWGAPGVDSLMKAVAAQGIAPTLQQFRAAAADTASAAFKASARTLNMIAVKHMGRRQFAEALEAWRVYTELHPTSASAHAGLGEAYLMLRRRQEAVASFERAVQLDPDNPVAGEYLRRLRS